MASHGSPLPLDPIGYIKNYHSCFNIPYMKILITDQCYTDGPQFNPWPG